MVAEDERRSERRAVLAGSLAKLRTRIAEACAAAGRSRSDVTLVAVTKTYPAEDVIHLAQLGVRDIGENKDVEAAPKASAVAAAGVDVRWHYVGQLQRNKCSSVVRYASLVHSVDSVRLVTALANAADRLREEPLDVLVQVSTDGDPQRGGVPEKGLDEVVGAVAARGALRLRGVMAVAPLDWTPAAAFDRLAELAARVRAEHPAANVISAGMSADLEEAIARGATHVRVGGALLGMRPKLG